MAGLVATVCNDKFIFSMTITIQSINDNGEVAVRKTSVFFSISPDREAITYILVLEIDFYSEFLIGIAIGFGELYIKDFAARKGFIAQLEIDQTKKDEKSHHFGENDSIFHCKQGLWPTT